MGGKISLMVIAIAIMVVSLFMAGCGKTPEVSSGFGDCLSGKDVKMYGGYWCSHCNNMKQNLGDDMKYITYIECSTPDGRGQQQICKDAGITGYPTIEYNGNLYVGEMSPAELAELTGCQI